MESPKMARRGRWNDAVKEHPRLKGAWLVPDASILRPPLRPCPILRKGGPPVYDW
jgi:hypothetical protein